MQVYQEVVEFEPPDFAARQLLRAGRITLVAQVSHHQKTTRASACSEIVKAILPLI